MIGNYEAFDLLGKMLYTDNGLQLMTTLALKEEDACFAALCTMFVISECGVRPSDIPAQ